MPENLVWSGTNYNGIDYKITCDGDLSDIIIDNSTLYAISQDPDVPNIYNSAIYNGGSGVGWRGVIITKTPMNFHQYYYSGGTWREASGRSFSCSRQNNTVYERSDRNIASGLNIYENFGVGTNGTTTYSYLPQFSEGDEAAFRAYVATPAINYVWHSLGSISGKMGVFSLSKIYDEYLGDGSEVSEGNLNAIESLSINSLSNIAGGLVNGESKEVAYSGEVYKLKVERTTETIASVEFSKAVLKFYLAPTTGGVENLIYSIAYPFGGSLDGQSIIKDSYIGIIIDYENEVAALNLITPYETYVSYNTPGTAMTAEQMHLLYIWVMGGNPEEEGEDPLDSFEDDEGSGGGDLVDRTSNPLPEPGIPSLSAYDTGFLSQYLIGKTALKDLSDFLWSANFWENVGKFFSDPRQIIMGICISPVKPKDYNTTPSTIKAGGISTGVSGNKLNKQFERYNFGEVKIERRLKTRDEEGGIYFDYSPFTECKLYLPFCGEHSFNISDVMGKTLKLSYTIDHVSGMCCAHVTIKGKKEGDTCHYNFTGQVGVQIPISSEDFGGFYRAMLSAGAAIGTSMATAATGGLTAPLAIGATANAIGNIANMGKDVQYTSGGGSVAGALSSEYPYITIEEPIVFEAGNQRHFIGYPYYGSHTLGNLSGFVKPLAIHLDGLTCTEKERQEIRGLIMNGVIIQTGDTPPEPVDTSSNFNIMLLQNISDIETIGKKFKKDSNDEVICLEVSGDLLYNQDISAINALIEGNASAYNYAYIPQFNRYYFIDSITAESGSLQRLSMSCDALQSFKDELLSCYAIIESAEGKDKAKLMVNNNSWFMEQKREIKTLLFKDNLGNPKKFNRDSLNGDECFLITIAGSD